jgi:hypothetical protein
MKYDDASWHYGGDFPKDLPIEAGATHIGMFFAWAVLSGLAGEIHTEEMPEDIERLKSRSTTPGAIFLQMCDGKLTDEDLNDEGNAFALAYYNLETAVYFSDYESTLGAGLPDLYYVTDNWENFDKLKPVLDKRFAHWRKPQS